MYLNWFSLPIGMEDSLIEQRMTYNGGEFGYIDNIYPCRIFSEKDLETIYFSPVTIFTEETDPAKLLCLTL